MSGGDLNCRNDAFDCLNVADDGSCHADECEVAPMVTMNFAPAASLPLQQVLTHEKGQRFFEQV